MPARRNPIVHLELHTGDLGGARELYAELCGWRSQQIDTGHGSYVALAEQVGAVECPTKRPLWLPYVEVESISAAMDRARAAGASVLLEPREGPAGWRSVVSTPVGGELAFWQAKR
jgi:predicted enzyme related to lactoylglutathione lyase